MIIQDKAVAVVVARLGSTRLPGKAMLNLAGRPVVWHVIQAALRVRGVREICLATTYLEGDGPLVEVAASCGVRCVRGHPDYVLDRVHLAARECQADIIVDIGGDCPLIDPEILSEALDDFRRRSCDYLCNYDPPTFPEGMDINIVGRKALDCAFEEALAPSQRVHPFSYLSRHPDDFIIRNRSMAPDLSRHHWSLDFPEDVEFQRAVFKRAWRPDKTLKIGDILRLIETDPEIAALDKAIQKPQVLHAFWNSPGILNDMNQDVVYLIEMAKAAVHDHNLDQAKRCYSEIVRIVAELQRYCEYRSAKTLESRGNFSAAQDDNR